MRSSRLNVVQDAEGDIQFKFGSGEDTRVPFQVKIATEIKENISVYNGDGTVTLGDRFRMKVASGSRFRTVE